MASANERLFVIFLSHIFFSLSFFPSLPLSDSCCHCVTVSSWRIFSRLANSAESIQHVGYTRSYVNMKPVRASAVRREARFTCAKQFIYGHVMEMSGSSSDRSRLHRKSQHRVHRRQEQQQQKLEQPQKLQSLLSVKSLTTMFHLFYISAFYLCFANAITFVAANSDSESGGKNGLSHLSTDVPTTTEFGESYDFMMIALLFSRCTDATDCAMCIHMYA